MEDLELKQLVADTGRLLLEKGLVARTWGNISVRKDETHFAISPSGLGYENMTAEDVPVYDYENETYEGSRKPSSEKKIHAAAYKAYPEVNFVIHTHQDYATALGLVGADCLKLTEEEKFLLGEVRVAGYGLPGTKKLKAGVEEALLKGSKVILMIHHGALICGRDRDDAIMLAELLEDVCRREVDRRISVENSRVNADSGEEAMTQGNSLFAELKGQLPGLEILDTPEMLQLSKGQAFRPQLDDMAQMIGTSLNVVEPDKEEILKALTRSCAVMVRGRGCYISTEDPGDAEALRLLLQKSAIAKLFADSFNMDPKLSWFDCKLMNFVYTKKYSKKKDAVK